MARVRQHDDQRPDHLPLASDRIGDHPQAAEVQFGHFSRFSIGHPHRADAAPSPVAFHDEPAQRRIRHTTAPRRQQLVDAGHLQPVPGQPLVNLVCPGLQQVLAGHLRSSWSHLAHGRQPAQLLLGSGRPIQGNALSFGRRHVLGNRVPRQAGARGNLPQAIARLPAANDLLYFHPGKPPDTPSLHLGYEVRRWSSLWLPEWPNDPENLVGRP